MQWLFFSHCRVSVDGVKHGWWDTWGWREQREWGERRQTQAGRGDKAKALYCRCGEAINNSVTMERERGREWRSVSRVYKRNTTKPGAPGASSCWALMAVRSGWLSILCLTAHSCAAGPWHQWKSATHLLNLVYTLKGDTMVDVESHTLKIWLELSSTSSRGQETPAARHTELTPLPFHLLQKNNYTIPIVC